MDNQLDNQEQESAQINYLKQELADSLLQHQLIAALLSADNVHPGVTEFKRILNEDYLAFANQETSLKEETAVLLLLQDILKELEVISSYPEFYKKRSVAVAGGFSAGKSQFISSLFENTTMRLPIGIQPTTAIPSYVMNGEKNEVLGCSIKGGTVDLIEIHPKLQEKLSHDFIGSFGFNLKSIMPYIFLSTAMPYENLCFIDTPGYNPSSDGIAHQDEDITTAENFTHSAEAVLWLIGADSNGTISATDLEFLQDVTDEEKPIYIVLNKADLKPLEDIKDIINTISEQLENYDIDVQGISAYDSLKKQELFFYNISLSNFLSKIDRASEKHIDLSEKLKEVENMYQESISAEEKRNRKITLQLSALRNDLLENSIVDYDDLVFERIDFIQGLFSNKDINNRKTAIQKIISGFQEAMNDVFGGLPSYETIRMNNQAREKVAKFFADVARKNHSLKEKIPSQNNSDLVNKINSGMDKLENVFSSLFKK